MTRLVVEITELVPAGGAYPWPTVIGTVVHGPRAGDVVRVAADPEVADVIADDLAALGDMPPVALAEPWQVVAVIRYADEPVQGSPSRRAVTP